jgi:hypothetical protein
MAGETKQLEVFYLTGKTGCFFFFFFAFSYFSLRNTERELVDAQRRNEQKIEGKGKTKRKKREEKRGGKKTECERNSKDVDQLGSR